MPQETTEAEYVPVVIVVKDGPWTYDLQYNRPPAVVASVVLGDAWRLRKSTPRRTNKPGR